MVHEAGRDFESVMQANQAILGRIAACYAPAGPEREDLLQDICLAIWRALDSFRGECSERTFVARIAHNRGLSYVYRKKVSGTPDSLETIADDARGPEAELGSAQRVERLYAAIRTLPVGYRQVLTLALEELPHKEIAEVVGISPGNVAVRLGRARGLLKARLETSK